jgi:hypothetical protein
VVFQIMGGMRDPSPHDSSYFILMLLTVISMVLSIPLIIAYCIGIYNRRNNINSKS